MFKFLFFISLMIIRSLSVMIQSKELKIGHLGLGIPERISIRDWQYIIPWNIVRTIHMYCVHDIWWMTLWLHWSQIKMPLEFIQIRCSLYLSHILKLHCNSNLPRCLLMPWHSYTTQDFWIHYNDGRDQRLVREAWLFFQTCGVDHPILMPSREHILKVSRSRSNLLEFKCEQGELATC